MEGKACFYSNLWRKPVALASQKIKFRNRVVVICFIGRSECRSMHDGTYNIVSASLFIERNTSRKAIGSYY